HPDNPAFGVEQVVVGIPGSKHGEPTLPGGRLRGFSPADHHAPGAVAHARHSAAAESTAPLERVVLGEHAADESDHRLRSVTEETDDAAHESRGALGLRDHVEQHQRDTHQYRGLLRVHGDHPVCCVIGCVAAYVCDYTRQARDHGIAML